MKKMVLLALVGVFCLLSLSSCAILYDEPYTRVATVTTVSGDSTTQTTNVYYRTPVYYTYPVYYPSYYYYPRYYYVPPRPHRHRHHR